MYFIVAACIANIALDYLFMGAMHLGPAGAALGTTCAQAIGVAVSLIFIRRQSPGISLTRRDLKPQRDVMAQILRIGIPITLQDGFIQISFIIITIIANRRGLNDAAAVGIVEKIISFLFLVPSSMLSTVSALGAQNIGAGKKDRAKQTLWYAMGIVLCYGLVIVALVQIFAEPMVALFTDTAQADGARVVVLGGQYLRGYVFDCLFAGIQFSFSGYFCACEHAELSFLHNILSILLVRVPGAYLASPLFPGTLLPMGLASAAGSLLSDIICTIAYLYLRKQDKKQENL